MNVILVSIDSLNRHFLPTYGQATEFAIETPHLDRFARRAAVFDNHYAGSLPCMPARREYFAGIQEFLWRPWAPLEPFDTSLALAARQAGALTQLVTDHYHYFQHGSHGYFEDYHGYTFIRGHENDAWQTAPRDPDPILLRQILADDPRGRQFLNRADYARNVATFTTEEDFFAPKVFSAASRWLDHNHQEEKWLLVVDSFDVHEPFHCPEPYASLYTEEDPRDPTLVTWPYYGRIDAGQSRLDERQLAFVRAQYAGKLTMVDRWFGALCATLDRLDLWATTTVIVTTDHGHFLGDHGWMGKPDAPLYNTLAHTPLFVWHPGSPLMGCRVDALTATVDLYATICGLLEAPITHHTHSRSLLPLVRGETDAHRDWALYGYWGSTVNVTDGRYTYLHPCRTDVPAYCYSTMRINPYGWFTPPTVRQAVEAGVFLPYTATPVWRLESMSFTRHREPLLFDLREDPNQLINLAGGNLPEEQRMRQLLRDALQHLEAPADQYVRLGLET